MPDRRLDPTFVRAQIEALRYSHPGIWDEGDEQLLADMLEAETGLHEFLVHVYDVMDDTEELIEGIDIKMDERKARRERLERRYQAMRELARKLMDQAGLRKVVLPTATLSIVAGRPKVIVTDEAALPPGCVRILTEPNREAIKKRIAAGETVPGAEMSNAEPYLKVSSK
jgi:Siphovirus Gp157